MDNSSKLQLLDYLEVDPESNEVNRDSSDVSVFFDTVLSVATRVKAMIVV